jgi:hypothetical protein
MPVIDDYISFFITIDIAAISFFPVVTPPPWWHILRFLKVYLKLLIQVTHGYNDAAQRPPLPPCCSESAIRHHRLREFHEGSVDRRDQGMWGIMGSQKELAKVDRNLVG